MSLPRKTAPRPAAPRPPKSRQSPVQANAGAPPAAEGGGGAGRSFLAATGAAWNRHAFLPGLLLFLTVAGVFLPALGHGFIPYDDPAYVTQNAHVTGGLTGDSVRWAFQSTNSSNWHPLTWLSHMADCQIFGLKPWGHHLTSVLLHALNAALLFVVLRRMTGAIWRSLLVAALFGLHPLHVESVAWIAERKDVLSTTFWMLTLWAYARRAELAGARNARAGVFLAAALLFFALGLMAKPMLVTIPCVLLLLDYWPLGRWGRASAAGRRSLLLGKLPFVALAVASSAVTLYAQSRGGTVQSIEDFPWAVRLANALIAYGGYLGKCLVPVRLAVFYPFIPEAPPLWQPLLAGGLLAGITGAAIVLARRRPYLLVGWLWFVGTLVPVIGLVQIGGQSMADRYTYVPLIGVFLLLAWSAGDWAAAWPSWRRGLGVAAAAAVVACAGLTVRQLGFWQDSIRLFHHALDVTTNDNWVAHANLYLALAPTDPAASQAELGETMRILADFARKFDRRGLELQKTPGHAAEAIKAFRTAVRILPPFPEAHCHLGAALAAEPGSLPEALDELQTALRLKPDYAEAHAALGSALARASGRVLDSIGEFRTALQLDPDLAEAHAGLGALLATIPGREPEAIEELQAALRLKPDLLGARAALERLQLAAR